MAQCKGFIRTCRGCGLRFHTWDRSEKCPDCGADRHCQAESVKGYNFCSTHGGPNPRNKFYGLGRGMTNGSNSSFALTRLASKYQEMMKNGRLLSKRHSIEIIRDRVITLMGRLDEGDAPDRLAVIEKLWEQYKDQKEAGQNVELVITAKKIDSAFEAARTDFAVWNQMIQLLDLDRKMVESEVKIAKEIKAIITAEEAFELVAKLMASIFTSVNSMESISLADKANLLKRIQYEFTRIVGDNIGEEYEQGVSTGLGETIDL